MDSEGRTDMSNGDFAARLTAMRERAGMSQYRLAKLTGLSKQTVSRLELGQSDPSWSTTQLIALALGLDTSAFVDPALTLAEEKPAAPRGRPRKVAEAAPKKRGK
jgi:transcriptional regulator with XRE-family HTH domain